MAGPHVDCRPYRIEWRENLTTLWLVLDHADGREEADAKILRMLSENGGYCRLINQTVVAASETPRRWDPSPLGPELIEVGTQVDTLVGGALAVLGAAKLAITGLCEVAEAAQARGDLALAEATITVARRATAQLGEATQGDA